MSAQKPIVLRQPTLSRRGLMAVASVLSLAFILLVAAMAYIYIRLEHVANDNTKNITTLRLLTHPTPGQFREQLKEGIKRCLAEPSCARLFPGLSRRRQAALHAQAVAHGQTSSLSAHEQRVAHKLAVVLSQQHRFQGSPPPAEPPKRHTKKSSPPRPPPGHGGGSPNPPPPPPKPRPSVNVETHLPMPLPNPSVCTTPLVGVNC